ncbi:MAG: sigma-70 family RNA polymerase sigma factor [Fimbriimonadaceae bacterium]|nr:sigma-70 family RNA polymerase sigma factor [Fimbriimonadaceae bacterium]QYK56262.1 MAG: sigma-70 family RNA polymerase sigma factor [Fimbriimonadaceae bacterium]
MVAAWIKGFVRTKETDGALFQRLMEDSYRQAYNTAVRLTGDATDAEDLLQETYLRAFRFFARYDESLPFMSWLYRIMTNVHIDMVRRKARLKTVSLDQSSEDGAKSWELPDETSRTDAPLMECTVQEPLELGLKAMTPEFRTAVVLADVEGLSYEEIAEIMDTSVGTVRSRIHRGRKQLRSYLEARGGVTLR